MNLRYIKFSATCLAAMALLQISQLCAEETSRKDVQVIELPEDLGARAALRPREGEAANKISQNKYLEAYIQGLVDGKFPKSKVLVTVRNGEALLTNLPKNPADARKIVSFVEKFSAVAADEPNTESYIAIDPPESKDPTLADVGPGRGMWFPQSTVLFPTMVANPRQICFSAARRLRDIVGGQQASGVTFGDQFPIYRWTDMWRWHGDLQLELEAGVFALFNHTHRSAPLINADYYAGIPLSYAVGPWAFRARIYHISSHLGDECHEVHPHVDRKNKSFEAIDFFTSYYITPQIRVFGGLGVVAHSDSEMTVKPLYAEYGFEVRVWRHDFKQLYGQPFIATFFRNAQENEYKFDATFAMGYEWGKIQGFGRKVRLFLEYHEGFSPDGQFSRKSTDYVALRIAYGF